MSQVLEVQTPGFTAAVRLGAELLRHRCDVSSAWCGPVYLSRPCDGNYTLVMPVKAIIFFTGLNSFIAPYTQVLILKTQYLEGLFVGLPIDIQLPVAYCLSSYTRKESYSHLVLVAGKSLNQVNEKSWES